MIKAQNKLFVWAGIKCRYITNTTFNNPTKINDRDSSHYNTNNHSYQNLNRRT